jgi:hypothetical protein
LVVARWGFFFGQPWNDYPFLTGNSQIADRLLL